MSLAIAVGLATLLLVGQALYFVDQRTCHYPIFGPNTTVERSEGGTSPWGGAVAELHAAIAPHLRRHCRAPTWR